MPIKPFGNATRHTTRLKLGNGGRGSPDIWGGDLTPLHRLSALRSLDIYKATFSNEDLQAISQLDRLVSLRLQGYGEAAHWPLDLEALAPLVKLEHLELDTVAFRDLAPMAALTRLTALKLGFMSHAQLDRGTFEQPGTIGALEALPQLEELDLHDQLGPIDLGELAKLKRLRVLRLRCSEAQSVTDLTPLRHLSHLEELNLSGTRVKYLKALRGLPLKYLEIPETVPVSELRSLRLAIPDLAIVHHGNG